MMDEQQLLAGPPTDSVLPEPPPQIPEDPTAVMPPEMAGAIAPEPVMPDPNPIMAGILAQMQDILGRAINLDLKVMADGVNTLATAYGTLAKTMSEGGISPQDQLMLEQEKMQHEQSLAEAKAQMEMDIAQQKAEMDRAKTMLDLQLKKASAETDDAIKVEAHRAGQQQQAESHAQTLSQQEQMHQQNITAAGTKTALQVQESEAKRKQMEQGPKASS